MFRSFRSQLTLLYLGLFALLFVLFSVYVYGGLSKSLQARIEETLASEADTAAGIFLDEFAETRGDVQASANETVTAMKLRGDAIRVFEGERVLASKTVLSTSDPHTSASRDITAGGHVYRVVVSASQPAGRRIVRTRISRSGRARKAKRTVPPSSSRARTSCRRIP